jgi:hypothetical protein
VADSKLSAKAQQQLGLPDGFKVYGTAPFGGMNQQSSPPMIGDSEFTWLENYVRIGDGNLRALWDVGPKLYQTSGAAIVSFFFYNIASTYYAAVFLADGSAVQVDMTGVVTSIGPAGTFYLPGGNLPAAGQWGIQYLLISNNNTPNDYWIWDGALLYSSGSIAPNGITFQSNGFNYSTAATAFIFGPHGTGISFSFTSQGGSIVRAIIVATGHGYQPGDTVQIAFSGGGSDNTPILQAVMTPVGLGGVFVWAPGHGYTSVPTVSFSGGGGGSGAAGTAVVGTNGQINNIFLTSTGSGYTTAPTVTISGGGGSGGQASAQLQATTVASVTIVNGGTGFNGSPPLLDFAGGGGAGATATATVAGGTINSVTVTAGGSFYTTAPAVVVAPGANNAAYASVTLMPFGVSGAALETFQQRVWLANPAPSHFSILPPGGNFSVSAPESLVDFATSDGAVLFTNSDSFLETKYTGIRQSNGYLYFFGDGSVSVVSNVQTSGSPATTTFNYQNVDPQAGLSWTNAMADFGRSIIVGNETGVYGLYGGSVTKISQKLDQIFTNAVFAGNGGLAPSAAVATIYNVKHFLELVTIQDPDSGLFRNVMVVWNEKDWTIASQTPGLIFIGKQKVSSKFTAWGTDGLALYPLFQTPSALVKRLDTKLYGNDRPFIVKQLVAMWLQGQDQSATESGIQVSVALSLSGFAVQDSQDPTMPNGVYENLLFNALTIPPAAPAWATTASGTGGAPFMNIGARLTSTSPDYVISNLVIGYFDQIAYI